MAPSLPAILDIDTGLESASDVIANQIATKLDLSLTPRLPTAISGSVISGGIAGLPADAAAAMARSKERSAELSKQLQSNIAIGNDQAETLADAIISNVEADQTIALQSDTAELTAENRTIEIFQALGGHAAQVDRAKDAREFEIKLEALSEKKADILDDKHTGIGIIDDVINGFRVIRTEAALDSTIEQNAINQQAIAAATATTESAAKTNALVKQTTNEGTIAANQRKIAAAGQDALYKATLAQNASNAETRMALLSASQQDQANIISGYALANSIEGRQLQNEQFQLALRQDARASAKDAVDLRRSLLAEQRSRLEAEIEGRTANARERSIFLSLDQQEVALDQAELGFAESEATSKDRIASATLSRTQAETNLDIANIALEQAESDAEDPQVLAAKQAAREAAIIARDRAAFELNELENTAGIRQAAREGALEGQTNSNTITAVNARIAIALEKDRTTDALAELETGAKARVEEAKVRETNALSVQAYQSFILGADRVEDIGVIKDQLASNNPVYALMRQLSSVSGPAGEPVLGADPSKANDALAVLEQSFGRIDNNSKQIRVLKAVRDILQKKDEKNPQGRQALDATGLAIRFNKTAREYLETKGSEIVFNDVTNPLQPPTIPQMVKLSPPLATQPLFSKVLIPDGNEDTNIDNIITKGLVARKAGTVSQEQVVEGIVAIGRVIAINNNAGHHGVAGIGLPYMTEVNMRVLRPRGFVGKIFDESVTAVDQAVIPIITGAIGIAGVLAAPASAGISLPAAGAFGAAVAGSAAASGVGEGGIGLQGSDFITLNIADPVAVRSHLVSVLSSSTLGGTDTNDILDAGENK